MELIILIIPLLLFFIIRLLKPTIKGVVGEKTVSSVLYFLNASDYKVINNVVLKSNDITSQIDHVVISDFGIFVIETKNYKGWIFGHENSEYWTQVIYNHKNKFYNPIRQNLGHIKALKNCLNNYPDLKYKSIIVFSTDAEIKVQTVTDVVHTPILLKTIKSYSQANLSKNDQENIFNRIKESNLIESYNKREHVKSINKRVANRKQSIQQNKCPVCGNGLIERQGKFGRFLGCKSYPNCKFTHKM